MRLQHYTFIFLLITMFLGYEYLVLNNVIVGPSAIKALPSKIKALKGINLSPEAGKPISYAFGWLGFGIMSLTNLYILRKRLGVMSKWGHLPSWLDFHIFCGMLGPILIVFHTNFKVGGLVAISFWSMTISASSGVIGRYFYMQLLHQRSSLKKTLGDFEVAFQRLASGPNPVVPAQALAIARNKALAVAGGGAILRAQQAGFTEVFVRSLIGDVRFMFGLPPAPPQVPRAVRHQLKNYALMHRKLVFMDHYRRVMGYWHSFHLPFAYFMYIIALVHIVAALVFGVSSK